METSANILLQVLCGLALSILMILFWQNYGKKSEEKMDIHFILLIPYSLMLGFGYNCTEENRFDIFFGFFAISFTWE